MVKNKKIINQTYNMSFKESKNLKSNSSGRSSKKYNPRVEALKVTVERKKQCNEKALQIVTDFSEGTISEESLVNNLKFINQEHYQDIVEERAINKLCGYPLCSKTLKNITTKQYHISTTLNKVFDITDRKNFCSNLCYKASKVLKDQVLTSPLWLREEDSTPAVTLISLQSRGGISGDEVDLGVIPVKVEPDNVPTTLSVEENDNKSDTKDSLEENINDCNISSTELPFCDNNKTKSGCVEEQVQNEETVFVLKDQNHGESKTETTVEPIKSAKLTEHEVSQNNAVTTIADGISINTPTVTKEDNHPLDGLYGHDDTHAQNSKTKLHKQPHKRKSTKTRKNSNPGSTLENEELSKNPIQQVVLKIEQILREWISVDTLCFIFGKEKMKELLAEKKKQNLPAFTEDVHFYERYLAICKKLNILELEDTKIDGSVRDEAKKPLPDYEALKEEAKQMEIKAKMFFKGDKVQFNEPSCETDIKSESVEVEPVLPLVDIHAQKALRRRIVIDKLKKVLQDLQTSLGVRGFNLTEDVRTLVSTLTLSAHNVTMKPAEWNLISLAVIKLLSLRDGLLAQALASSTAKKHLTLLLLSYSLDSGYLDRLMVWLTDIEAILQKT